MLGGQLPSTVLQACKLRALASVPRPILQHLFALSTAIHPRVAGGPFQAAENDRVHVWATGFLAFGLLSLLPPLAATALLFMTLGELAIAFSTVVIDGVAVD